MTNKQLERRLAQAWGALRPKTELDTIVGVVPTPVASAAPKRFPRRALVAVLAACLVVSLVVGGLLSAGRQTSAPPLTLIDIDVNPGIELAVDAADRVVTVQAVNADGKRVLNGLTLSDKALPEAVTVLFDRMVAQGYVAGEDNCILVTVQTADNGEADRIANAVSTTIDAALAQHDIAAPVATQTVVDFAAVTDFAAQNGISKGKANFILSLKEKEPSLDAAKLAQYPFSALAAIAQNLEVPLDSLTDYDAVSGLNKQLADALKKEADEIGAILLTDLLTPEEAKAKALASLRDWEAAEALFVKAELRWDGGVPVYQFELIVRNHVYEFAVNALDGGYELPESQQKPSNSTTTTTVGKGPQVVYSTLPGGGTVAFISTNKYMTTTTADFTKGPTAAWTPRSTTTSTATNVQEESPYIDREEALRYAMAASGVTSYEEVHRQKVMDRVSKVKYGVPYYYVWLCVDDAYVFEYDIDGITGAILSSAYRPLGPAENTQGEWIDHEKAISLAIIHADARSEMPTDLQWNTERSPEGAHYYYVEFASGGWWYAYRIHAFSGEVLHFETIPII